MQMRRKHPRRGPRKLLVILARQYPTLGFPAASTVGDLLKKRGLVGQKRRRIRSAPYPETFGGNAHPNAIWCADVKGHVPEGERCNPLTIRDGSGAWHNVGGSRHGPGAHQPLAMSTRRLGQNPPPRRISRCDSRPGAGAQPGPRIVTILSRVVVRAGLPCGAETLRRKPAFHAQRRG